MTDDFFLDRDDQRELIEMLETIVEWLADDLDTVLIRQTRYGTTPGKISRGKNPDTPMPYNTVASDISYDLMGTLQAWVDHVATQRQVPHPGLMRSRRSAQWLIDHIIHLSLCDDTDTILDEITDAITRTSKVCDRPVFRRYQGSCEVCDGDLWSKDKATSIVCEACLHVVSKEDNDRRIDEALEARFYTANELVEIVHDRMGMTIKPKTVHDMAYRKVDPIIVRGQTYNQQKLYKAGDVFRCLRARKAAA